ncbi:MAG TPA: hypothetical protein VLJ42_02535 [Solirubrobacteraceae bacterium]|nr:hypothetical protein [Solirubrobacteraceae bacterium]
MGKRNRNRNRRPRERPQKLVAPSTDYSDTHGNVLTLRGSLTPATRLKYAETLSGNVLSREDAWHRALELLFEHLAVRWAIAGAPIERQRELLARFRAATPEERAWVRGVVREHCAEHFPDVQAP